MPRPKLDQPRYRIEQRRGIYGVAWTEAGRTQRRSLATTDYDLAQERFAQFRASQRRPRGLEKPIRVIIDGYLAAKKSCASHDRMIYTGAAIKRHMGALLPQNIGTPAAEDYAAARKAEGVKAGTIIKELTMLRAACHWAQRQLWGTPQPLFAMPVSAPPPRRNWITRADAERLYEATKAPHLRVFLAIAMHTGARAGAILDLEWARVDLDRRRIDFGQPRGNKRRAVVPINDALLPILQAAHELRTCEWVVEHAGKQVASIKRGLALAAARIGIKVTPHMLRHSVATWLVEAGLPVEEIGRLLGDSPDMIRRVYGHHSPDYLARATAILGRSAPKNSADDGAKNPPKLLKKNGAAAQD